MGKKSYVTLLLSLVLVLGNLSSLYAEQAEIKLASPFLGAPILQRNQPVQIWGRAEPGTTIYLSFADQEASALVAANGSWQVQLKAMEASAEGRTLAVSYGPEDPEPVEREDVVVGDIWIAAGQSNMEFGISTSEQASTELKDAKYPAIRLFLSPKSSSGENQDELLGAWLPCNRGNLTSGGWNGFSAVAFYFARTVFKETKIPQGIIQTAYGGSPIESWIGPQEMVAEPSMAPYLALLNKTDKEFAEKKLIDPAAVHPWNNITDSALLKPAVIWRAMIRPLAQLSIKGILWYQGESNVGNGPSYTGKMKALIQSYRSTLGNPTLPFYFVQLAPWNYGGSLPSMWASQEAGLSIPGTAMAISVDLGLADNIHPPQKKQIGERLAVLALNKTYQRSDIQGESPFVQAMTIKGSTLELVFAQSGKGLKTTDGTAPRAFSISTDGATWLEAKAVLKENKVILSHPDIQKPKFARYAWVDVPTVNLVGSTGLPVRPWGGMQ